MCKAADLQAFVNTFFGERAGESTVAVGFLKNQQGVYIAMQGGRFTQFDEFKAAWNDKFGRTVQVYDALEIIDSRLLVETKRKKSEWTGYHAEMMVLSAMICANAWKPIDATSIKTLIENVGGGIICANAPCCTHCEERLTSVGVEFAEASGRASTTAWWNPLTDARYAHADFSAMKM